MRKFIIAILILLSGAAAADAACYGIARGRAVFVRERIVVAPPAAIVIATSRTAIVAGPVVQVTEFSPLLGGRTSEQFLQEQTNELLRELLRQNQQLLQQMRAPK